MKLCKTLCLGGCLAGCGAGCAVDLALPFGDTAGATIVNAGVSNATFNSCSF